MDINRSAGERKYTITPYPYSKSGESLEHVNHFETNECDP